MLVLFRQFGGDEVTCQLHGGASSTAQGGAPIRLELVALGWDREATESPNGARFPRRAIGSCSLESRPFRAQAAIYIDTQGSASLRPGLSNLAPLGLKGDFVADKPTEQNRRPVALGAFC